MTFDELYQIVQDLKDENIHGDTKVYVFNADDDESVECTYVTHWIDESSEDSLERDGYIEIG